MPEKVSGMTESTSLADNDLVMVIDDSTGAPDNVKVTLATLKAFVSSTGGGGGSTGISHLGNGTLSTGSTSLEFTTSTGYSFFEIKGWISPSSTTDVRAFMHADDGGGYDVTSEYEVHWWAMEAGTQADGSAAGTSGIWLSRDNFQLVGGGTNEGLHFGINITRATDAAYTIFRVESCPVDGSATYPLWRVNGAHEVASALSKVRIKFASGGIASANVSMIGYR